MGSVGGPDSGSDEIVRPEGGPTGLAWIVGLAGRYHRESKMDRGQARSAVKIRTAATQSAALRCPEKRWMARLMRTAARKENPKKHPRPITPWKTSEVILHINRKKAWQGKDLSAQARPSQEIAAASENQFFLAKSKKNKTMLTTARMMHTPKTAYGKNPKIGLPAGQLARVTAMAAAQERTMAQNTVQRPDRFQSVAGR